MNYCISFQIQQIFCIRYYVLLYTNYCMYYVCYLASRLPYFNKCNVIVIVNCYMSVYFFFCFLSNR